MSTDTIRRALELAESGKYANVTELRTALAKEGCEHIESHFRGLGFKRHVIALIKSAKSKAVKPRQQSAQ